MGSDGDDRLGGADFDAAIANYLTQQHSQLLTHLSGYHHDDDDGGNNSNSNSNNIDIEALVSSCDRISTTDMNSAALPLCTISSFHTIAERLKIELSQKTTTTTTTAAVEGDDATTIVVSASCLAVPVKSSSSSSSSAKDRAGSDTYTLQSICNSLYIQELQLTLEEYNSISKPLFDRAILPVTRLLKDLTLQPTDIDEIVMVGGTTKMPQIRTLVGEAFSAAQLNTHIDPDITVAYGAASVID
jgi:molecular chaperone DnaK (HSP70)